LGEKGQFCWSCTTSPHPNVGRVKISRDMKDKHHLFGMGIEVKGEVTYDREGIANHAKNLANTVKGNLEVRA